MTDDTKPGPKKRPGTSAKRRADAKAGAARSEAPRSEAPVFDMDITREAILEATLTHVPFDGWTLASLRDGVRDAGLDESMAVRAFPGGIVELVEFHSTWADQRMLEGLARQDLAAMKVRKRVAAGVRLRLEQSAPHREAVRRAVLFLARPQRAALACRVPLPDDRRDLVRRRRYGDGLQLLYQAGTARRRLQRDGALLAQRQLRGDQRDLGFPRPAHSRRHADPPSHRSPAGHGQAAAGPAPHVSCGRLSAVAAAPSQLGPVHGDRRVTWPILRPGRATALP